MNLKYRPMWTTVIVVTTVQVGDLRKDCSGIVARRNSNFRFSRGSKSKVLLF